MTQPRELPSLEPEQLHRVREIWASTQPDPREVRAAFRRWPALVHKPTHRSARPAWLLVAATLLIGGGAFAYTGGLLPKTRLNDTAAPSESAQSKALKPPEPAQVKWHQPTAESEPAVEAVAETIAPPPAAPRNSAQYATRQASPLTTAQVEGDVGSWSKVAEAMRQGDETRVGTALEDLSHSRDSATRDAARLTRAQLDIAGGQPERAHAVLIELAETGATPLVRRRAQAMLQR